MSFTVLELLVMFSYGTCDGTSGQIYALECTHADFIDFSRGGMHIFQGIIYPIECIIEKLFNIFKEE